MASRRDGMLEIKKPTKKDAGRLLGSDDRYEDR
jgi:hypothetical protein